MATSKDFVTHTPNIQRLNANNYSTWKFKMEMLLLNQDLFDVIEENPPDQMTDKFAKKDRQARALINLYIEDDQIIHVKHETNARSTWNKLKAIHERSGLTSKLYLLRKLYSKRLEINGNMEVHINSLLEIIDKLRAIGEEIKESHISALLLCSLPASYENLITALEARKEDELTPEYIKGKLIDEYRRRLENSEQYKHNPVAFKTANQRHFNKEKKFCTYCHKNSHNKSDCWFLKNKQYTQPKQPYRNDTQKRQEYQNSNKNKHKSSICKQIEIDEELNTSDGRKRVEVDIVIDKTKDSDDYILKADTEVNKRENPSRFYVDSGATCHMSSNLNFFTDLNTDKQGTVTIANGKTLPAKGTGSGYLKVKTSDGKINRIKFENVLFVPELEGNLISVKTITEKGNCVIFKENKCFIQKGETTIAEAIAVKNLYELITCNNDDTEINEFANSVNGCKNDNCIHIWHRRLGHRDYDAIKKLEKENLASGININNCKHETTCTTCIKGKMAQKPYPKKTKYRAKTVLELVHSDLCGPINTTSIGGNRYFITFVDDFSRFTMIYLVSHKNEFLTKLKEYAAVTMNKFKTKIKTLRSDNGGEYVNRDVEFYLKQQGIEHQLTVPHSPPQNGTAERKNRTLVEMTRCLLNDADLPQRFWGEAVQTATYLQNRLPTKANDKTPIELWTGIKPSLQHIKTFGCKAFAYINKHKRGKLDDKAVEGIFIGYDNRSKGYRIYLGDNNIIISRTVKFIENTQIIERKDEVPLFTFKNMEDNENDEKIEVKDEYQRPGPMNEIVEPEVENEEPRRSERSNKGVPPDRLAYTAVINRKIEPSTWKEITEMENPEKQKWIKATEDEIKSLHGNKTWTLTELPEGKRVIGSKWTFKTKYNSEGIAERYKARLVAKGFNQKFGVDYDETFAPVVKHTTIRAFLAAAAYKELHVRHIDIKTAFLHGRIEEEVYMSQPEGYVKKGEENKVCKLEKAIYGLKQAARSWHIKIGESLMKYGFVQSQADSCLFKLSKNRVTTYIILYVDDILIAGNEEDITKITRELEKEYEIKDLGEVTFYLGIHINRTKEGNFILNQENKIDEVIEKFNLTDGKPTYIPMDTDYHKLDGEDDRLSSNKEYRSAVGALLYIATVSRPDISLAVNLLSRRNENPRQRDWNAVKKVIRYLKTTKNIGLVVSKKQPPILTAHADADWGNDRSDRRSTSGNIFKLGESSIQWISKKQNCVAMSSTEAEYISAANATLEILWLKDLLKDFDLEQRKPIILYEDNQSCIKLAQSEKYKSRTKHIDVKYHKLRELKESNIIDLEYCSSKEMIADILTKPLPKPQFEHLRKKLLLTTMESHSEIK